MRNLSIPDATCSQSISIFSSVWAAASSCINDDHRHICNHVVSKRCDGYPEFPIVFNLPPSFVDKGAQAVPPNKLQLDGFPVVVELKRAQEMILKMWG